MQPALQVPERTPKQILIVARGLIAHQGWTRNACARNIRGVSVWAGEPSAVCFCAFGALQRAAGDDGFGKRHVRYMEACNILARAVLPPGEATTHLAEWNDEAADANVILAGFDRAIAGAE